jgi:NitT/TauT family transport system substrate-binding protein
MKSLPKCLFKRILPAMWRSLILVGLLLPGQNASAGTTKPLRVALLPILDSFPFYVAQSNGYFKKCGLEVKAVPVASGLERDQLMQAGEIDGMLNEMISTANFNREQPRVKIISIARKAYPDYPLFRVLTAPKSGIASPQDLTGASIGISRNTIIEYVTDRLLAENKVSLDKLQKKSIPVIPERFQLLLQGHVKAATLPDPLAKSAMVAGASLIIDDAAFPKYSMSVLTFSNRVLFNRTDAVRNFMKAWDMAAEDINTSPEAYRDLLLNTIRIPKNIQTTFKIPVYPRKEVPESAQWLDVMNWMVSKGMLSEHLPYEDAVTREFLPK